VTGDLTLTIDADTGELHYLGSIDASGKVTGLSKSVAFDVGAEIVGSLLIFDFPLLGRETIRLP
jgi:hypothetical protein